MLIKIDNREQALKSLCTHLINNVDKFKTITLSVEPLSIGDIIINDGKSDILIIERKTISDLLSSIKDGRYEEQSYRLNGSEYHNHNIIYLIEGDPTKYHPQLANKPAEKSMLYSAMFSLNYYKGFSVFRSVSIDETAFILCNMAYKINKDIAKQPYYNNTTTSLSQMQSHTEITVNNIENNSNNNAIENINTITTDQFTDKDYINVVKKIKKENITTENIDELMLCQIPGISSVTAIAIIQKYKTIANLIKTIEANESDMTDLSYTNDKGQTRKINKTCVSNIIKYLLKK